MVAESARESVGALREAPLTVKNSKNASVQMVIGTIQLYTFKQGDLT